MCCLHIYICYLLQHFPPILHSIKQKALKRSLDNSGSGRNSMFAMSVGHDSAMSYDEDEELEVGKGGGMEEDDFFNEHNCIDPSTLVVGDRSRSRSRGRKHLYEHEPCSTSRSRSRSNSPLSNLDDSSRSRSRSILRNSGQKSDPHTNNLDESNRSTASQKRVAWKQNKDSSSKQNKHANADSSNYLLDASNISHAERQALTSPGIEWGDQVVEDDIPDNSHSSRVINVNELPHIEADFYKEEGSSSLYADDVKKNERRPSLLGGRKKKRKKLWYPQRRRNSNIPMESLDTVNMDNTPKKKKKYWYIIVLLICFIIIGAFLGYLGVKNKNAKTTQQESTTNEKNDEDNKLPWDVNATPCADFIINVRTDRFGNETSWELFYSDDDHEDSDDGDVGVLGRIDLPENRKRLRQPHQSSGTRRRLLQQIQRMLFGDFGGSQVVLRNRPYPYVDNTDPTYTQGLSTQHTSSICLPVGHYKFVIKDSNGDGLCCRYGLGEYILRFGNADNNEQDIVYKSNGIFENEDSYAFYVDREDIVNSMKQDEDMGSKVELEWVLTDNSTVDKDGDDGDLDEDEDDNATETISSSPTSSPTLDTLLLQNDTEKNSTNTAVAWGYETTTSSSSSSLVVSITGNLTLTNLAYPDGETQVQERTLAIEVLENSIQDVAKKVLEDSINLFVPSYATSETEEVIIKDVLILGVNGDAIEVVTEEKEEKGVKEDNDEEDDEGKDTPDEEEEDDGVVKEGVTRRRGLSAHTVVEFIILFEEPCGQDICTLCSYDPSFEECADLLNTTAAYYEKNVAPYMYEQVMDGSFTAVLLRNTMSVVFDNAQNSEFAAAATSIVALFQQTEVVDMSDDFEVKVLMATTTDEDETASVNNDTDTLLSNSTTHTTNVTNSTDTINSINNTDAVIVVSYNDTDSNVSTNSTELKPPKPSKPSKPTTNETSDVVENDTANASTTTPISSPTHEPSTGNTDPPTQPPSLSPSTLFPTTLEPSTLSPTNTSSTISPSTYSPTTPAPTLFVSEAPTKFNPVLSYSNFLLLEGIDASSKFGTTIDYSDEILAIGSPAALNGEGEATGAVFLYSLDAFTKEGSAAAVPEPFQALYGTSAGDKFGNSVALAANRLVIGSPLENGDTGATYIYEIIDTDIVIMSGKIDGNSPGDNYGLSVAVSDEHEHCRMYSLSFCN